MKQKTRFTKNELLVMSAALVMAGHDFTGFPFDSKFLQKKCKEGLLSDIADSAIEKIQMRIKG